MTFAIEPSDRQCAQPAQTNVEEQTNADQHDPELPSMSRSASASILDPDVSADSEDIDVPMSVLAHVELARTSRKSFFICTTLIHY